MDGGSTVNVVSQTLVTTLGLETKPVLQPYTPDWISGERGRQVTKKVYVTLQLDETYRQSVWCDVAPMTVSHILLGRP